MVVVKYFLKKPEVRSYKVQGRIIKMEVNDKVFPPPLKPSVLARNLKVFPGERVIDIGTGSGILALVAAKLGGNVCGTDISNNAIALSKKNAELNNVTINFSVGDFFKPFNGKFDVIIANLSQTIVPVNYQRALGKELSETIYGGETGNEVMLNFLSRASKHMHRNSRLYVVVYSVSDYMKTIKVILNKFNARLLEINSEPTKEFVTDNLKHYLDLNQQGKISIFKDVKSKTWYASQYVFELTIK